MPSRGFRFTMAAMSIDYVREKMATMTQGVEVLRLQNRTIDEFFHLAMAKIAERAAERIREREEPR